jgi:pumilio family protein 6
VPEDDVVMMSTALAQLGGSLNRLVSSPIGSRVLQSCVKHGKPEHRKQILEELRSSLVELSKSPYAHFLVCKLINTAPKPEINGNVFQDDFLALEVSGR